MSKNIKQLLVSLFITTTIASLVLLVKFGSGGGPCNAGIVLILLGPVIIISAIVQIVIFSLSTGVDTTRIWFRRIISVVCSCGWIYLTVVFSDGEPSAFSYLTPMLILNLAITILIFIEFRLTTEL